MKRLIASLLAFMSATAFAATVTRGQFVAGPGITDFLFSFGYGDVTYTGGDEFAVNPAGAHALGPISISVPLFDGTDMGGTYTAGGVTTSVFYGTMELGYNSELFIGGPAVDVTGAGTFFGTFGFGGTLCAYAVGTQFPPPGPGPCLNTGGAPLQVTGSGTVQLTTTAVAGFPGVVDVTQCEVHICTGARLLGLAHFRIGWNRTARTAES
jgi:hypothetical protein